jgi:elongator complex protein 2
MVQMKSKEQVVTFLTSYAPQHTFSAAGKRFVASIHGVLLGHEDWVHSVAWIPRYNAEAASAAAASSPDERECPDAADGRHSGSSGPLLAHKPTQQSNLQLLTASMDRTIMIWGPDKASGLWMCEETVGDAGAARPTSHVVMSVILLS